MHLLKNSVPLTINYGEILRPGEWLCQDEHAFQWAMMAPRGTCELHKWISPGFGDTRPDDYPDKLEPKSILLIRSGAIGDLLLLSPCMAAVKAKYPNATVDLCCFEKHWEIMTHIGPFNAPYPLRADFIKHFDLIIPLEGVIERATDEGIHATDAFAAALGVTVTDFKPVYKVVEPDLAKSNVRDLAGGPKNKPRVGLQIHASSAIRDYPMQNWNKVMKELLDRGWEIMLLGKNDGIKGAPPAIKDCSGLSFREAAAVLSTCDVFCGVDSSFFNLCPALGVPAIGLFGPVDWRTRVKEGSGQLALSTAADCAPCGWTNSRGGMRFPSGGPCNVAGYCVPLAQIDPARVAAKIDSHRK